MTYRWTPTRTKYGSKKITVDGETFDAKKELRRWQTLRIMEDVGMITDLRRQVKYILIPAQREPDHMDYSKSARGRKVKGKLLEHEVAYYADFVYQQNGETIVEDAKGVRTEVFKLKKKLMLWVHGIRIREV